MPPIRSLNMKTYGSDLFSEPDSTESQTHIAVLRSIAILALIVAMWFGRTKLGIQLPTLPILAGIGILVVVNLAAMLRLQSVLPIKESELFLQLLIDVMALSVVLFFSGGITNPFVSFYLVFLTAGAILLPQRYSWPLAGMVLASYTTLIFFFEPLIHTHDQVAGRNPAFNLHTVGMWITFALSTLIVSVLMVRMVTGLRARERRLARAREESLRNERIVAIGAFAAGTAHELGTPLSTIAVIAKELERRLESNAELRDILGTLRTQVEVCKRSITNLA
jgi:two-component system, sensor histidine kinase RegB